MAVPGSAAPPGFPPSPAPGHGRPFSASPYNSRPEGRRRGSRPGENGPIRSRRLPAPFAREHPGWRPRPGAPSGSPAPSGGRPGGAASSGCSTFPASSPGSRLEGGPTSMRRSRRSSRRRRPLVAPGLEDSWARDGASESAVVVDEERPVPRASSSGTTGLLPPSRPDRVDDVAPPARRRGSSTDVSYMVAVADAAGRVVLANAELRSFFGEALAGRRAGPPPPLPAADARLGRLPRGLAERPGSTSTATGSSSSSAFRSSSRTPLRYVTLAIHDVSALVGEQLAQAHEELEGLRQRHRRHGGTGSRS